MQNQDLLRGFMQMTKRVQEDREGQKIKQLYVQLKQLRTRYAELEQQHRMMRENYDEEVRQLRLHNIKLESENKTVKMRSAMLQNIMKQEQSNPNVRMDPNDLAAYRIVSQENKNLKELIKKYIKGQK